MPFIGGVGARPLCLGGDEPRPSVAGQLLLSITNGRPTRKALVPPIEWV